ncbi:MAG: phosphoribosylanthranilate isomerase, partial [Clostridiales bacterium]|nr:phosphoribosylanthranilate isomerase [Candidatus Blautia equi]
MTKIKLCGLSRPCDIEIANELNPDYIGFVFFKKSIRDVSPEKALELKRLLSPSIQAVGVFVNEPVENVSDYLN